MIQQQGADRIVVQLPGVQDTAKAKDIIGRTATLEVRMVDDSADARAELAGGGPVPFGTELFTEEGRRTPVVRQAPGRPHRRQPHRRAAAASTRTSSPPCTHRRWTREGGRMHARSDSRENIGKRMAIVLFEKGKARSA